MRQEYFHQPLRAALDIVDEALRATPSGAGRKLVILGDPGSGKSSLIRYLALRWAGIAEPTVRDTQPIPLVVDLRAYGRWQCDGRKDFVRFLEEAPVWHEWPRGLFGRLLERPGRVVLLLDGLDEVFDVKIRADVIEDIQRFNSRFAHTPIIVTSRVVGYQSQRLRDAEFRHFMLQDLDSTQITDFVNRWHEVTFTDPAQAAPKRDRLQRAIRESKSIAMLAGNPLLLTMMAILNRNQELPRDRADLYAQASRVLLHQWDTERALVDFPGMSNEIGLREKTDILRRIAAHMQAAQGGLKGNLIDGETLTGLIETYLQNELHYPQARAAARAVVEQLRQRNFILCFVGADSYAFVHRTFLEYFCAADFVHQFNVAKTLDINGLIGLFDQHCRDDEWREVLRLICGQIDEAFVGKIVERLATCTDLATWDRRTPLPELVVAILCLTEVRALAKLSAPGARLMSSVISYATEGQASQMSNWQDVLTASQELGERWPGKQRLLQVAITQISEFATEAVGFYGWPRFVAAVASDRDLVIQLCVVGGSAFRVFRIRESAIEELAEKWPDQTTRDLLAQRALQDDNYEPRSAALQALAEKWPDQTTRDLLAQRAVQDVNEHTRSAALQALAEKWPDQTTRDLLAQRAVEAPDISDRGAAYSILGKMHSEFGRILPTRDLDGTGPYLDPREPIPREHIEKAAAEAGIRPEDIDAQVASLSAHLGWDVTVGTKKQAVKKTGRSKPGRKRRN